MSRSGWFEEDALVTQVLAYDDDEDEDGDWTEDDEDEDEDDDWEDWDDDEDDDDMFGRKRPQRTDWN